MTSFSGTTNALLLLMRRSLLHSSEQLKLSSSQWKAVAKAALAQSVTLLAVDGTNGLTALPPKSIMNRLQKSAAQLRLQNRRLYKEQDRTLRRLRAANIPAVVINGCSVSVFYPIPALRTMNDIDLLVDPRDVDAAIALFTKLGYANMRKENRICFQRGSSQIDLHFAISGLPDGNTEAELRLRSMFARIVDSAETCDMDGHAFPAPVSLARSILLLLKISSHAASACLSLRDLADWGMLLHKQWKGAPSPAILQAWENCRLLGFARALSFAAYQALNLPMSPWFADVTAEETAALLSSLANEVDRTGASKNTALVARSSLAPSPAQTGMFRILLVSTVRRFPAVRKYPFLYIGALPCTIIANGVLRCKRGKKAASSARRHK